MELINKVKKLFKEEDKIIQNAMSKINYLLISRNISQKEDREELLRLRRKFIKDIKEEIIEPECPGCIAEMEECYNWQKKGYDSGLNWEYGDTYGLHCKVFVLNKNGEFIVF